MNSDSPHAPLRLAGHLHVVLQITTLSLNLQTGQVCDELPTTAHMTKSRSEPSSVADATAFPRPVPLYHLLPK